MDTVQLDPSESRVVNFTFAQMPEIVGGDTIQAVFEFVQETKKPASAIDIDIVSVAFNDKVVQPRMEPSSAPNGLGTFEFRAVVDTVAGNRLVGRGKVEVRNDL